VRFSPLCSQRLRRDSIPQHHPPSDRASSHSHQSRKPAPREEAVVQSLAENNAAASLPLKLVLMLYFSETHAWQTNAFFQSENGAKTKGRVFSPKMALESSVHAQHLHFIQRRTEAIGKTAYSSYIVRTGRDSDAATGCTVATGGGSCRSIKLSAEEARTAWPRQMARHPAPHARTFFSSDILLFMFSQDFSGTAAFSFRKKRQFSRVEKSKAGDECVKVTGRGSS
jgi:hypothetical protein